MHRRLPRLVVPHLALAFVFCVADFGCAPSPYVSTGNLQKTVDRAVVEYPTHFEFRVLARGLSAPTAIAVVDDGPLAGCVLVAENGGTFSGPRILAIKPNADIIQVFPPSRRFPLTLVIPTKLDFEGPIGGMLYHQGRVYISHRDHKQNGVITSINIEDGSTQTVVANLPAQGDFGVSDLAVRPTDGRLFFGMGSATNSGVVGTDNWAVGWVGDHPDFCDMPLAVLNKPTKINGDRFNDRNPRSGLLGGDSTAVTSPFAPFNAPVPTRLRQGSDKPTSAIYSVSAGGGDLRVEATGIRYPRGLAFDEYGNLYFTNDGMEMRGTRPVKDDPDALLRLSPGFWYGFPDYSADLHPISDPRFKPPDEIILPSAYNELAFVIDHAASGLSEPVSFRDAVLRATFPSLSGAAKIAFAPSSGPFKEFRGQAIVALSGDRAPFATSGRKLNTTPGRSLLQVDVDPGRRTVKDFIRNTSGKPASQLGRYVDALERPVDVKFAEDKLYILDYGQMNVRNGQEQTEDGTGKLFILVPEGAPPTTTKSTAEERFEDRH